MMTSFQSHCVIDDVTDIVIVSCFSVGLNIPYGPYDMAHLLITESFHNDGVISKSLRSHDVTSPDGASKSRKTKDIRAFGGYEKSEEDHRNLHVIAKYFRHLQKRVSLYDFGN